MKSSPWLIRPQVVMGMFLVVVAVWGYFVAVRDPVFRNWDQANIALTARNLISGNGFTTDAMWIWIRDWGTPRHPEDSWPPLQAFLAALSFLLLGPTIPAFQAVVIAFFIALLWTTYAVGKRLMGPWEGVIASGIVFANPILVGLTDVGTNDVGAAFLYLAAMYAIYRSLEEKAGMGWVIAAAVLTGISINQKFQGILFVIAYGVWQLFSLRKSPGRVIKRSLVFLAVLFLMGLPLMIRNYLAFGQLTYPTSQMINYIAACWDPMYNRWRMNIVYFYLYWKHDWPTYGYILSHRGPMYLFVEKPWYEIKRLLLILGSFEVVTELALIFGALGIFTCLSGLRRWAKWNGVVAICSFSFVLFGQMESRYFVFLVPMMALFSASFLSWSYRRLRDANRGVARLFALTIFILFIHSGRSLWSGAVTFSPGIDACDQKILTTCALLRANLSPGEGVMGYRAAEMAFAIERYGACPPNVNLAEFIEIADRYKLRYLVIELANVYLKLFELSGTEHWLHRQLAPLYMGREAYGFKLVYSSGDDWYVYRIPRPDEVDLKVLPKLPPEPDDFTRLLLMPDRGGYTQPPPPLDLIGQPGTPTRTDREGI